MEYVLDPESPPRPPPPEQRPERATPPRRHAPYERPAPSNYHWSTVCAVRESLLAAYDAVYDMHDRMRRGVPPTERDVKGVLNGMADLLSCGVCGNIISRLDSSCFVAKCGHVYHKAPMGCWTTAGRNCCLASCAEPAPARRFERPARRSGHDS